MRRRLLFSTLAVAVTAVVLFGLPLAFVLIRLQTNAAHQLVQRDATTVARTLENRLRSGLPPDPTDAADAAHSLPDRFVSVSLPLAVPLDRLFRSPWSNCWLRVSLPVALVV